MAASIVARLKHVDSKKEAVAESEEFQYDFYKDSEIQMAFNDKNFEKIRNGCFRNQFQTNSSNGANARDLREKTELKLVDVVIDGTRETLEEPSDPSHHIRPKYAYFVPTKPMEGIPGHNYVDGYGNVYAVMKNEVKDRSTFTHEDSLGANVKAKALSVDDYKEVGKHRYGGYWETQVWGSVCFSDVSHFIINCPGNKKVPKEILEQMNGTGIPVYECNEKQIGANKVYAKGQQLIEENLKLRKLDENKVKPKSNFPEKSKISDIFQKSREAMEAYAKSPEGIASAKKAKEVIERRKAYMASPEGIAEAKKAAEDMEAFWKSPEGLKAKATMEEEAKKIEAYWKSPEGIAAKAKHDEAIKKGEHSPMMGLGGMYPGMGMSFGGGIGSGVDCKECGVPSEPTKSTEKTLEI